MSLVKIPIADAKRVADKNGLSQVLLIGYDGDRVHVVTYGKTKADCASAAAAQKFWLGHIREFAFKQDGHRAFNEAGDRVVRCWCGEAELTKLGQDGEHGFKYCTPRGL